MKRDPLEIIADNIRRTGNPSDVAIRRRLVRLFGEVDDRDFALVKAALANDADHFAEYAGKTARDLDTELRDVLGIPPDADVVERVSDLIATSSDNPAGETDSPAPEAATPEPAAEPNPPKKRRRKAPKQPSEDT